MVGDGEDVGTVEPDRRCRGEVEARLPRTREPGIDHGLTEHRRDEHREDRGTEGDRDAPRRTPSTDEDRSAGEQPADRGDSDEQDRGLEDVVELALAPDDAGPREHAAHAGHRQAPEQASGGAKDRGDHGRHHDVRRGPGRGCSSHRDAA
ncbi:hypothetical protein AXK58_15955 [Tsukamurella tyrosinosolvens]|nr:hypothetical protein AXK58_15955 [Tsukamurella tyrosinosolvens]